MRKVIFWIHLVVGVTAALVILIMSLTGVLLMYQRQITAWADGVSVTPPPGAQRLPVESLLQKGAEIEPGKPSAITIGSDPSAAASISFGREKTVFVDPYSGALLGEGSKNVRAFFRVMIDWHRWLGMHGDQREFGKAITGASNLGFLFLVLSGIYLWWPRTWNLRSLRAVTLFDRSATGKARDWNWHNVVGIWSAIPLAIVVFTAIFFSYPWATEWLYRAAGEEPPPRRAPAPKPSGAHDAKSPQADHEMKSGKAAVAIRLNGFWATAEKQVPGWRTITLRVPDSPKAPLSFTIDRGNGARPDLRSQLTLNSQTGEVQKWESYQSQSTARKIRLWVRWIHTGEAGGWIGQTIAGAASAGGVVLVWTGLSLAIRRFLRRKISRPNSVTEAPVTTS